MASHTSGADTGRWAALDGWRGLSIVFVLACHLLPLGPKPLQLNLAAGGVGMALFFALSGFLVTSFLIRHASLRVFLVRRMARIFPLFAVYVLAAWWWFDLTWVQVLTTFAFVANLPPQQLAPVTAHLWSLCLEVQFYVFIAVCSLFRRQWLVLVGVAMIGISVARLVHGDHFSSITYLRGDEVLAGAVLAFSLNGQTPVSALRVRSVLGRWPLWVPAMFFMLSCHPDAGWFCVLRPYFAMWLIGASLSRSGRDVRWLTGRRLKYLAEISFALYVIHPFLAHTWLGSGSGVEKYIKRPLLFAALWALAHVSTFKFESRFTRWARAYDPSRRGEDNDGANGASTQAPRVESRRAA